MRRTALGLLLVAAACGDNLAPAVMIESTGAAWIATRGAPDQPWVRHDGARASFDADPTGRPYDVVVVCRADAGEGQPCSGQHSRRAGLRPHANDQPVSPERQHQQGGDTNDRPPLSLIHISEPTRPY